MNQYLLSTGASIYAGLVVLSWTPNWVYIPATTAIIPSLVLAVLGIAFTALGILVKGRVGLKGVAVLWVSGFFLGVFGFISWFNASDESYHVADVCQLSRIYHDGYDWACPQVQTTNQITWTLAASLVIPAILFLAGFLSYVSLRYPLQGTPEKPSVIKDAHTATS